MQVELLKKSGKYISDEGVEKNYTNFYIRCGDSLIPIEPCYFPNRETGKDNQYIGRKEIMKAFAGVLPEIDNSSSTGEKKEKKPKSSSGNIDGEKPPF